jgi:hypothetical protein
MKRIPWNITGILKEKQNNLSRNKSKPLNRVVFLCPFLTSHLCGICIKIKGMITNLEQEAEERKAGRRAAATLRNDFRNLIRNSFKSRSGKLEKSTVTARYKEARLDRLVISQPSYSFQSHFGSTKSGTQGVTTRKGADVKGFNRHVNGKTVQVSSYNRAGGKVKAFNKNRNYNAYNHIARALQSTKALETLATDLGNNRITQITSQINF